MVTVPPVSLTTRRLSLIVSSVGSKVSPETVTDVPVSEVADADGPSTSSRFNLGQHVGVQVGEQRGLGRVELAGEPDRVRIAQRGEEGGDRLLRALLTRCGLGVADREEPDAGAREQRHHHGDGRDDHGVRLFVLGCRRRGRCGGPGCCQPCGPVGDPDCCQPCGPVGCAGCCQPCGAVG